MQKNFHRRNRMTGLFKKVIVNKKAHNIKLVTSNVKSWELTQPQFNPYKILLVEQAVVILQKRDLSYLPVH